MALTLPVPASSQFPQALAAARSLQPMRQRWRRSDPAASSETVPADGAKTLATVAVIGGGVAGLACARRLGALGFKATVFDTGKRGPGGRASSRTWRGQVCDHASQFVTATDKDFAELLTSSGAVRPFGQDGRFGTLSKANFEPLQDGIERWVGLEGMGGIVRMLAEGLDIQQDVWVPPSNGLQCSRSDGRWGITVPGPQGGREVKWFDAAVIAHNGKCAERLTSSTPAQEVHALLRTNFACSLPRNPRPGSGRFTLNQIYSLLFEVPSGLMPASFDAAFVEDEPILRWLSSNTAKLRQGGDGEVWTALSSAPFGKQHKAPQEFLEGTPKETEVVELMLYAVERAVGLAKGSLLGKVRATKLQLWGAALPITRWASRDAVDFAWSACHRIGIAGDWLSATPARASTVEAAWLSGVRLAEHIARAGEQDAGIQLGQDGGVFLPVEADFGTAAGEAVWVTEPADEPKGKGKGRGSGKGWKGKAAKSSR